MRNIIAAVAISLSIVGCTTMPPGIPFPVLPGGGDPGAIVTQVQTTAQQICRFVPTAETILGVIGTFTTVPFAGLATQAADAICAAVNRAGVSRGGKRIVPRVNGIAIKGKFVR